jgi:hypothetical protein
MKITPLLLVVAMAVLPTGIGAQQVFSIFNPGSDSCGARSTEQNLESRYQRNAWVYGFFSAYNFYSPEGEAVEPADGKALIAWIDNYCAAHPLELIVNAATRLVNELRKQRGLPTPYVSKWRSSN